MRKILVLFLATSFLAFNAMATEPESEIETQGETLVEEGIQSPGVDEDVKLYLDENAEDVLSSEAWESYQRRYRCPRGFERVPSYRWDRRLRRWVFDGYNCRRMRWRDDDRWGRDRDRDDRWGRDRDRDHDRDRDRDRRDDGHRGSDRQDDGRDERHDNPGTSH